MRFDARACGCMGLFAGFSHAARGPAFPLTYALPMLTFAAPILLAAPAGLALLGAFALFRGRRRARAVSSLRLWADTVSSAPVGQRRRIDPAWLLVYLGAIAAALVLAQPQWVSGPLDAPWATLDAAVE